MLWLVAPLALAVALRPNLYDGMRHFLFLIPPVCLLAALGARHVAERLRARGLGGVGVAVVTLLIAAPLVSVVRLHPYQTSYFNVVAGGLAGAEGRFEVDYWGTGLTEAMYFVNAHRGDGARGRPTRVLLGSTTSPYPKAAVEYAAASGIEVFTLADLARRPGAAPEIDYYLAPARYALDAYFEDAPILFRVERDGVSFAVVRDMGGAPVRALPASLAAAGISPRS